MDKKTKTALIIVVIIIALAIFLWLATRRKEEADGTTDGNGGADLINAGTTNYIEVTPIGTTFSVKWYNQPTQGLTGSNVTISDFSYWVNSWLNQGLINQTQYTNAVLQYHNLGY